MGDILRPDFGQLRPPEAHADSLASSEPTVQVVPSPKTLLQTILDEDLERFGLADPPMTGRPPMSDVEFYLATISMIDRLLSREQRLTVVPEASSPSSDET